MHYNTKDLAGMKFGKLTVIMLLPKRINDNRLAWYCKCDCGNEVEKPSTYLKNTKSCPPSCGCEVGKKRVINVELGTKKGKLTVIAQLPYRVTPNGDKHTMIKCKCDCGNETEVNSAGFRKNRYLSCGKKVCKRQISNSEMITNYVYKGYKSKAKERNYSFNLTKDFFSNLIFKNCYYCNSEPKNTYHQSGSGINGDKQTYYYNGIDRIDNSIGYEINNVRTCCGTCNTMKMTLSDKDFINHLRKIIENIDAKHN